MTVEETDNDDGSAASAPKKIVQPTGPPVKAAQTKLTVFQVRYNYYTPVTVTIYIYNVVW